METLTVPYFVSLRPTAQQFSSATDFFAKNCLAVPTRPAVASPSPAAKGSRGRGKRGVMADSDAHSLKVRKADGGMGQQRLGGGLGGMRTLVDSFIKVRTLYNESDSFITTLKKVVIAQYRSSLGQPESWMWHEDGMTIATSVGEETYRGAASSQRLV